jgi:hypothetical protein
MDPAATIDELLTRWEEGRSRGEETTVETLCRDHPELVGAMQALIADRQAGRADETAVWATRAMPASSSQLDAFDMDGNRLPDFPTEGLQSGLRPPEAPGELGRIGPFVVLKLLGAGGMGAVYQGVDPQLGRFVALKVLRPRLADSSLARERFLREARAGAALEHDHVVAIYQVGEDNGTHLASGGADATVRVWGADGAAGPEFSGQRGEIISLAWSADGTQLASGSRDTTVRLWDSRGGGAPGPVLTGNTREVNSIAWSADGKQLATACHDGTVRLWGADGTPKSVLTRYDTPAYCVAWSPDGTRLATGDRSGDILLWGSSGAPGPKLKLTVGQATSVAWHPDSAHLAIGGTEFTVRLWDIKGVAGPVLPLNPESDCYMVGWAKRGEKLWATSRAGFLRVWNARTLELEWISFQTGPFEVTAFDGAGRLLHTTPAGLKNLVYLVERADKGIDLLSHEEFVKVAGTR